MPIEQIVKMAAAIVIGIAVMHPTDFAYRIRKMEFSILKEASRVDWDQPSLFETEGSIRTLHKVQTRHTHLK